MAKIWTWEANVEKMASRPKIDDKRTAGIGNLAMLTFRFTGPQAIGIGDTIQIKLTTPKDRVWWFWKALWETDLSAANSSWTDMCIRMLLKTQQLEISTGVWSRVEEEVEVVEVLTNTGTSKFVKEWGQDADKQIRIWTLPADTILYVEGTAAAATTIDYSFLKLWVVETMLGDAWLKMMKDSGMEDVEIMKLAISNLQSQYLGGRQFANPV